METFSEKLRSLLSLRGMSQKSLADAANLTQGAISKYLNGLQEPKSRELYSISKVLNVSMDFWFGEGIEAPKNSDWKAKSLDLQRRLDSVNEALSLILQGTKKLQEAIK